MRTAWISVALLGLGCAGRAVGVREGEPASPATLFRRMTEKITRADSLHARVTIRTVRNGVPGLPDCVRETVAEIDAVGGRARLQPSAKGAWIREIEQEQTDSLIYDLARLEFRIEPHRGATREPNTAPPMLVEFRRLGTETIRGEVAERIGYIAVRGWGSVPKAECLCTVWISVERGLPIKRERRYAWKKIHTGRFTVTETFETLHVDSPPASDALALAP